MTNCEQIRIPKKDFMTSLKALVWHVLKRVRKTMENSLRVAGMSQRFKLDTIEIQVLSITTLIFCCIQKCFIKHLQRGRWGNDISIPCRCAISQIMALKLTSQVTVSEYPGVFVTRNPVLLYCLGSLWVVYLRTWMANHWKWLRNHLVLVIMGHAVA
jgi:aspartyl/asparaginyl-tRNA synthetase